MTRWLYKSKRKQKQKKGNFTIGNQLYKKRALNAHKKSKKGKEEGEK